MLFFRGACSSALVCSEALHLVTLVVFQAVGKNGLREEVSSMCLEWNRKGVASLAGWSHDCIGSVGEETRASCDDMFEGKTVFVSHSLLAMFFSVLSKATTRRWEAKLLCFPGVFPGIFLCFSFPLFYTRCFLRANSSGRLRCHLKTLKHVFIKSSLPRTITKS